MTGPWLYIALYSFIFETRLQWQLPCVVLKCSANCCCSVAKLFLTLSLQRHGLQHVKLLCPSSSPRFAQIHIHWLVMPSNHPSSVVPFSLCLQSFPASGSFPVSWLFTSDGQSIQLQHPSNEYSGLISFRINWFDLFAVQGTLQGLSKVFSSTTVQKHQFFGAQPSSWSNSCIHTWLLEKPQL